MSAPRFSTSALDGDGAPAVAIVRLYNHAIQERNSQIQVARFARSILDRTSAGACEFFHCASGTPESKTKIAKLAATAGHVYVFSPGASNRLHVAYRQIQDALEIAPTDEEVAWERMLVADDGDSQDEEGRELARRYACLEHVLSDSTIANPPEKRYPHLSAAQPLKGDSQPVIVTFNDKVTLFPADPADGYRLVMNSYETMMRCLLDQVQPRITSGCYPFYGKNVVSSLRLDSNSKSCTMIMHTFWANETFHHQVVAEMSITGSLSRMDEISDDDDYEIADDDDYEIADDDDCEVSEKPLPRAMSFEQILAAWRTTQVVQPDDIRFPLAHQIVTAIQQLYDPDCAAHNVDFFFSVFHAVRLAAQHPDIGLFVDREEGGKEPVDDELIESIRRAARDCM